MQKIFNETLRTGNFPDRFKLPDLDPVFKMNNPLEKENYRPVSVLLVVSNIFETIIQQQVTLFKETLSPPYLCGNRKGFSTQQHLRTKKSIKRRYQWIYLKSLLL